MTLTHAPTVPAARAVSPQTAPAHRAHLDGLRGLAALWVVLSHLWISQFGIRAQPGALGRATNWLLYSHLAVDVFLVLSGCCLILPVARDGVLAGGMKGFFQRRARRILPPFYAALLFSLLAFVVVHRLDPPTHSPPPPVPWLPALGANALLVQDVYAPLNIFNGPFWSIAVEWRLYFLFPVMVWVLTRWGHRTLLAGSALAGTAGTALLLGLHPEMQQASPWFLILFALGICAGSLASGRTRRGWAASPLGWPCAALCFVCLGGLIRVHPVTVTDGRDFGNWLPLIDVVAGAGTAALLLALGGGGRATIPLAWPPLAGLGAWAYSLYLVHMPCLMLLDRLLTRTVPALTDPLDRVKVLGAAGLPVIFGLSYLFFLACERPFLRRRPRSGP